MDTFAAFALATESPLRSVLHGKPWKSDSQVLTAAIWRQIIGMTLWNTICMALVIGLGPWTGDLKYDFTTSAQGTGDKSTAKLKHLTYIFNTFVFLQIFNQFNCRKIGIRDFNILEGITGNLSDYLYSKVTRTEGPKHVTGNLYFLLVVGGTFTVQILALKWFPALTRQTVISRTEWGSCLVIGFTPLLIAPLLKMTPESWLAKLRLDKVVDENRNVDDNKILQAYNKTANIKVGEDEAESKEDDDFKKA